MLDIGRIVKSVAGHDKNKFYVIVDVTQDSVYIADGKERKLEKPKRKNVKHIRVTNTILDLQVIKTNKKLAQQLRPWNLRLSCAEPEREE